MQFAQMFPDFQIVSPLVSKLCQRVDTIVAPLARKLSWSHFIEELPLKEPLQFEFYLTMAANFKAVLGLLFFVTGMEKIKKFAIKMHFFVFTDRFWQ